MTPATYARSLGILIPENAHLPTALATALECEARKIVRLSYGTAAMPIAEVARCYGLTIPPGVKDVPGCIATALLMRMAGQGHPIALSAEDWAAFRGPRGGKGWKNIRSGTVRYQVANPGGKGGGTPKAPAAPKAAKPVVPKPVKPVAPKPAAAPKPVKPAAPAKPVKPAAPAKPVKPAKVSVEQATAHVGKLLAGGVTPEHVKGLATMLQGMTVADLTTLKKNLGVKASGAKAVLAQKIAERALVRKEEKKTGTNAIKPEAKAQEDPDDDHATLDTGSDAPAEKPKPKVEPKSPREVSPEEHAKIGKAVIDKVKELAEKDANFKRGDVAQVPIHEIRRYVADQMGEDAARHEVLDEVLLNLWREKTIGLDGQSDGSQSTQQQKEDGIPGTGDSRGQFYIDWKQPAKPEKKAEEKPVAKPAEKPAEPSSELKTLADKFKAVANRGGYLNSAAQAVEAGKLLHEHIESKTAKLKTDHDKAIKALSELNAAREAEKQAFKKNQARGAVLSSEPYMSQKKALEGAASKAIGKLLDARQAAYHETMGAIRPMGIKSGQTSFAETSTPDGKKWVENAAKFFPTAWLEHSAKTPFEVKHVSEQDRTTQSEWFKANGSPAASWYRAGGETPQMVLVSESNARHEMFHRMEDKDERLGALQREFYEKRTAGKSASEVAGCTLREGFAHPYLGMDYGKGSKHHELLSKGFDLYMDSTVLDNDPEFKHFLLGVVGGKL